MITFGTAVDCVGHPSAAAVVEAGHRAVALYVGTPGRRKAPNAALVYEYLAHNLALILVFEDSTGSWRGGRARGIADARAVLRHLPAIGIDPARAPCIYFAFDEDLAATDLPLAREYVTGAESVLGSTARVGAYGGARVCQHLLDAGLIGHAWAAAGWQYGHPDPRCALQQHVHAVNVGGVPCDVNIITRPDYGQYPAFTGAAPPTPPRSSAAHDRAPEDVVTLLEFPPTPLPRGTSNARWQDTAAASWPLGGEQRSALVPAVVDGSGWRGRGSISSITCGWAGDQDGPDRDGHIKPSGFVAYLRVFGFADQTYRDWQAHELVTNAPLVGNRSLRAVPLPSWCTFLVVRYAAPGGLFLGVEWEH